jgi:hypothetical protein
MVASYSSSYEGTPYSTSLWAVPDGINSFYRSYGWFSNTSYTRLLLARRGSSSMLPSWMVLRSVELTAVILWYTDVGFGLPTPSWNSSDTEHAPAMLEL